MMFNIHDLAAEESPADARAERFVAEFQRTVKPLEVEACRRSYAAQVTGTDEDFRIKEEAERKLDRKLADPQSFAALKAIRKQGVKDPLLARQIEVLYLLYLPKQLDPELLDRITAKENALQKAFNTYRARVGGKELTENDVRNVLRDSNDPAERKTVWEASKAVGPRVEADFLELVRLRNAAARKLGYPDFFALKLATGEQNPEAVFKVFDELDAATKAMYREVKAETDAALADRFGCRPKELRPWHYSDPFVQQAQIRLSDAAQQFYRQADILKICRAFYQGIGLPIDDVLQRSDLYEKPGKNPHAFCEDVDRAGDVRILVNIVPGREWLATTLHELGHAAYDKYIDPEIPFAIHTAAHPLTTEGIALMVERVADHPGWLTAVGLTVPDREQFQAEAARVRRHQLLFFSRWSQVMLRFEKELYADPDQDLNKLWWDLVEKYQEVPRPEGRNAPDYLSKIHFICNPVYYHNYLLGDLFASQVHHAVAREVYGGADPATVIYADNAAVGRFLRERVFAPGRRLSWNELTRFATGEELNAKAYAEDLQAK
ncbi:MAG: M2 family metallopeptidase [Pirellulales bacterium]|nr:M2 family metallopeptidase [Pirellulales bacterium]